LTGSKQARRVSLDIVRLLEADGPLARQLPGFAPRPQQQAMARAVETALL